MSNYIQDQLIVVRDRESEEWTPAYFIADGSFNRVWAVTNKRFTQAHLYSYHLSRVPTGTCDCRGGNYRCGCI